MVPGAATPVLRCQGLQGGDQGVGKESAPVLVSWAAAVLRT
jgi:hypothetical protein